MNNDAPSPAMPAAQAPDLETWVALLKPHCGAGCRLEPLPGNASRLDHASRAHFRVVREGSTLCFLTIGPALQDLFNKASAFAVACPAVACKPLFLLEAGEYQALGFEYFPGKNLETLWRENSLNAEQLRSLVAKVVKALAATAKPSSAEAREQELSALFTQVLALPFFSRIDRGFLVDSVFPLIRDGAKAENAETQWTNGDFIPRNVLATSDGDVRLIDCEFASATHFPSDNAWRWKTFSCLPESLKDLPEADPLAHTAVWKEAHFLLRQLVLAFAINGGRSAEVDSRPALDRLLAIAAHAYPSSPQQSIFLQRQFEAKVRASEAQAQRIEKLESLLKHRDEEVKTLRKDIGWQVSEELRALRHKFFGRRLNVPFYFIDSPVSWRCSGQQLSIRGWCLSEPERTVTGIRASVQGRTYPGQYGLPRPDVAAQHTKHPQAETCGFVIETELRAGDKKVELSVRDENGVWHVFLRERLHEGGAEMIRGTYAHWVKHCDSATPQELDAIRTAVGKLPFQPRISVILPVFNAPERFLIRAIESVREQLYAHWELCIADDASTSPHVRPLLEHYSRIDSRIKVNFRPKNGHIAAASNSALELATGEYIAMLDHDDEIRPHALAFAVDALNKQPDAQLLYCDEDKIDEDGHRFDPYFKPDWMPDLLTGHNYMCHFCICRADTVRRLGGWRSGFDGAQDWDLELRVIEKVQPQQIVHIPRILYHWRAIAGSTARAPGEKDYVVEAARRALSEHFQRIGDSVELIHLPGNHWRVKHPVTSPAPLASLVIPTRNGLKLLQRCLESIFEKTTYPKFEVIVVDNNSDDPATLAYLEKAAADHGVRVLRYREPFNYPAVNNFAVREAKGSILVLLNNDMEVITPGWLDELVSQVMRPEIGCVGAMLYFPNDTLQHAGVVLGIAGHAGHAFKGFRRGTPGYMNHARLMKNYSAVTGACLAIRKSVYEEVGGLDEQAFAVSLNDVDFCLKVRAAGYRNLWTPFAELYHHESATRGYEDTPEKQARFAKERETLRQKWLPILENDPAYNPNLTNVAEDFGFAYPPRVSALS
jgi:glycosyltransferase involved in cell wall biosynthesis